MKYKVEVTIDIPRDKMLILFEDMEFMKKWQNGFESLAHIEGNLGEVGGKSVLKYNSKGKTSEIVETILQKDLPNTFNFLYEAKGVENIANNTFVDLGKETKWIVEHEFKFTGFMKLMSKLFKGAFIAQTTKDMNSFKYHAEQEK